MYLPHLFLPLAASYGLIPRAQEVEIKMIINRDSNKKETDLIIKGGLVVR
jgi:hypothetical protein